MQVMTIRDALNELAADALLCLLKGDKEGALASAGAGKKMAATAGALGMPLDAPYELLETVALALGVITTTVKEVTESTNEAA